MEYEKFRAQVSKEITRRGKSIVTVLVYYIQGYGIGVRYLIMSQGRKKENKKEKGKGEKSKYI